jgi:putative DNA methylase
VSEAARYPKRLIEVDLPIKRISAQARREKSIRHGHISTLHIWWARRPLAACRAVILAALWPDPADPLCPDAFRQAARTCMQRWTADHLSLVSKDSYTRFVAVQKDPKRLNDDTELRRALLDFIADFADWDNSTNMAYLETSRALVQAAHEALGGLPGTRALVVDPFAGGGSIPLEALRVGADAFASDLNPVAVLLNKVVLEYIPTYGQRLADEVRRWGAWVKEQAEKELAEFYPRDRDGATPIAYLWARTIISEAPGQGDTPVEVPLMRSLWLAKKKGRNRALRWVRDAAGRVQTETVEVTYADGVTRRVQRPLLEVFEPKSEREVESGTVAKGSATCPVTGYTTPVKSVRTQFRARRGGASDARLFCVVTTKPGQQGRFYRLPTPCDAEATRRAAMELERQKRAHTGPLSLVPDETLDVRGIRHTWAMIYGLERWGDYFTPRQALALATLARLVHEAGEKLAAAREIGLATAVQTCLAMTLDKQADYLSSLCTWHFHNREKVNHTFARQALPFVADYVETVFFGSGSGNWDGLLEWSTMALDNGSVLCHEGKIECTSATAHPLPDDSCQALITDPPYYDGVPYAYLSDFFYVWLRRTLRNAYTSVFADTEVPKDAEIVVDRPHELSTSTKDIAFYESELTKAFADGRRVLRPDGIGAIVFASKTTTSWEAILQAVVDAGWTITGSWPIDTEMETRVAAQGQARLASSVHLVCRPREDSDGSLRTGDIGEWRDVLAELPRRIHEWMPRLAAEGVVGADAIFACLGPALEVFSRYACVEKASGEQVALREYLEQVWAAVAREALSVIFKDADASGLEADARLTAMWLWTLSTNVANGASTQAGDAGEAVGDEGEGDEEGTGKGAKAATGYSLEFDAARKIAQGLGAHLENLTHVVQVKGETARLLSVSERTRYLFGKDEAQAPAGRRKKSSPQLSMFPEAAHAEEETGWGDKSAPRPGATTLDRVHQAMILFAAGRAEALKRFLVEEGAGHEARFWRLAQSLSALYPAGSDEKRWVDGVLARKKGLGF